MVNRHDCPKCSTPMLEGFIVDETYGAHAQSKWSPGEPKRSFWKGLKLEPAKILPVTTWRCERCGLLESYAYPGG
jgi:hypothetical protein